MLAIADIAGQYDALLRLVARVPESMPIILLGDLVDRGHESHKVIQWAIDNAHRCRAVLGNHEHMMIDYYKEDYLDKVYDLGIWKANGGSATIAGYSRDYPDDSVLKQHLEWLKGLPLFIQEGQYLFTHAPLNARHSLEDMVEITKNNPLVGDWNGLNGSLIWNRSEPKKREGIYQIFGHNSHWGLLPKEGWICLDQSRNEVLTGLLLPEGEILEEPYLRGTEPITVDL